MLGESIILRIIDGGMINEWMDGGVPFCARCEGRDKEGLG